MAFDAGGTNRRAVPTQPSITVTTFMLDRYEVTVGRFRRFVESQRPSFGFTDRASDAHCNYAATPGDRDGHPMNCVEWQTAKDFCRWDTPGGTLPSEAQWEYAARGAMASSRPWPWGGSDSAVPDGRVCWNRSLPTPLGTCPEEDPTYAIGTTPDDVWHLVGNVWEWTADLYQPYNNATCWGGRPRTNATCEANASGGRTVRGGSWIGDDGSHVRSGARNVVAPAFRVNDVGFRCAGVTR